MFWHNASLTTSYEINSSEKNMVWIIEFLAEKLLRQIENVIFILFSIIYDDRLKGMA